MSQIKPTHGSYMFIHDQISSTSADLKIQVWHLIKHIKPINVDELWHHGNSAGRLFNLP